jgi:TonB family protein
VAKRVLPNVAPGATQGMRGPVEVEVRVSVNEDGAVSSAEYVSHGPGNYFARISRQAAQSWRFSPPETDGLPQPSVWTLRFHFVRGKTEVSATEVR